MSDDIKTKFSLSYADLISHCNAIHVFATRDVTEMTGYGKDQLAIDAFETQINEFEELPTDEELLTDQMLATETKNAVREELEPMLRSFSTRGKLAFGDKTLKFRKMHVGELTKQNDNDLLVKARRVKRNAVLLLTELSPFGLTQLMIDDLTAKNQAFEDAIDSLIEAIGQRDNAAEDRVDKANALYDKMIEFCNIGKTVWFGVSDSRYNDYLIYSVPPGVPGKIQDMAYDIPTGTCSWSPDPLATFYELQFCIDQPGSEIWTSIHSGPELSFAYDPGGPDNYKFRCRGFNDSGPGLFSDVLLVERI